MQQIRNQIDSYLAEQKPSTIIAGTLGSIVAYKILAQLINEGPQKIAQNALSKVFRLLKKMPGAAGKIEQEKQKMLSKVKNAFHNPFGDEIPVNNTIPEEGMSASQLIDLLAKIRSFEQNKLNQRKLSGTVYIDNEEQTELLTKAFSMFIHVNPLHADVFPSGRKFESEICRMTINMMHGDDECCGFVTSGGTESILMAVKAYRDLAREEKGHSDFVPEIIASTTVHAAFEKAAHYFGCKIVYVQADPKTFIITGPQVRKAITRNTIVIVGSAPNFPQGTIDPIEELAAVALEHNIPFHTDACLGGFVLPFAKELGYKNIPNFDFAVPGVTSISADTHKYGCANKGSSVLMFRNHKLRQYMYFVAPTWTGGIYASPAIAGSRAGSVLATTWTAMVHMGKKGYMEQADKIMKTAQIIKQGVEQIPELELQGDCPGMVVAFTTRDTTPIDIFAVADAMGEMGWALNVLQYPKGIHFCVTGNTYGRGQEFVDDLRKAVAAVRDHPEKFKNGMAPIYGSAIAIPDKSLISEMIGGVLDAMLDIPPPSTSAH
jgi:sphinganine-1-phosphate aldolase